MNRSEWICNILDSAIEKERQQYRALHSIFGRAANPLNEIRAMARNEGAGMPEKTVAMEGER